MQISGIRGSHSMYLIQVLLIELECEYVSQTLDFIRVNQTHTHGPLDC